METEVKSPSTLTVVEVAAAPREADWFEYVLIAVLVVIVVVVAYTYPPWSAVIRGAR